MKGLSTETKMSIQEVATILGVNEDSIQHHVRNLFPGLMRNGVKTFLTESQVYEIKQRMQPTKALVGAVTEIEMLQKSLEVFSWMQSKIQNQEAKIAELTPRAEFADHVAESAHHYDFREACKELAIEGIGQKRLFGWCRSNGILMASNEPYQEFVERGLLKLVLSPYTKPNGKKEIGKKPVWTGKGLQWLDKKLRETGFLGV